MDESEHNNVIIIHKHVYCYSGQWITGGDPKTIILTTRTRSTHMADNLNLNRDNPKLPAGNKT